VNTLHPASPPARATPISRLSSSMPSTPAPLAAWYDDTITLRAAEGTVCGGGGGIQGEHHHLVC
jgi:hypothetical protein